MRYEIVFRGKLVTGFGQDEVRRNLAALFKTSEERIDHLLGGSRTVLKTGLDRAMADRYRGVLRKAGAVVAIVGMRDEAAGSAKPPAAAAREATPQGPDLAEPGATILAPRRIAAPTFDLSAYTLAELGVTFDETAAAPPTRIETDHLSAELSDDPLDHSVRPAPPPFDLEALALTEDEGPMDPSPSPPPPAIDTSRLEATPVDEPLDGTPPPPPAEIDTSALRLDDS